MMKNRICVVGAGRWGKNHINNLIDLGCLGGVVDTNKKEIDSLKLKYPRINFFSDLDSSFLHNFDGYIIATPSSSHASLAKEIIKKKKPVLVEKPLAHSLKDAKALEKIINKTDGKLLVGHLLLFHPAILKMKKMIDQGDIGDIQYIYSNRLNLGIVRKDENVFWSFAPHDIALFQFFSNSFPSDISSSGGDFLQNKIHDTTMTYLKYPNKIHGHIYVSWLHPFKEHRLVIIGTKGSLHFEDKSIGDELFYYNKQTSSAINHFKKETPKRISYSDDKPLMNEIKYFIDVINGHKIKKIDIKKGIDVVKILELATNSLKS